MKYGETYIAAVLLFAYRGYDCKQSRARTVFEENANETDKKAH